MVKAVENRTTQFGRRGAPLAVRAAGLILRAFDTYAEDFARITKRARRRFERRDWKGRHRDAMARLDLYEQALDRIALELKPVLGDSQTSRPEWMKIRRAYTRFAVGRHDLELAETFYNSVTRKILRTVGIDREIEYFDLDPPAKPLIEPPPVFQTYADGSVERLITQILTDYRFTVPYEDVSRDAERVAREVNLYLWPVVKYGTIDGIDVIRVPFFRNKVAYLIGRIRSGVRTVPLVLPLYNGTAGVYVDTVLLTEAQVSIVFSFAFSYFHIQVDRHDALIDFLRSILPNKHVSELYISIGYAKHGKTEFYRDLHHYVHEAREKFVIAPGKEGAVMIAFTLPDYGYVFKVIKDNPCFLRSSDITNKRTSRAEVMERYSLVRHRDRVGRMVDTQEFENLRFKKKRFSQNLLKEFVAAAKEAVCIQGGYVVVRHLYVQRKVTPLPMYLLAEKEPERVRDVIVDFGYFLKDLAATGIFPYDLFNIWNYGVTRRRRVVLFDYDDVQPLENTRFLQKPPPRDQAEEFQLDEDRIASMPDDFFMDEIERYSGVPQPLKGIFKSVHADLFSLDYWRDMQRRVRKGEIVDITPYELSKRFSRTSFELPTNR